MLSPATVSAYLERIGHDPVGAGDVPALASLQDAHVRRVPFENLDIHLGRQLSLDLDDLAAKIISQHRGGFCFELNGLFAALLTSLGYTVRLVEARTRAQDGGLGPRFDHVRILVTTEVGLLLVDVGNGASPRGPIRLDGAAQQVGHVWHRVLARGQRYDSEQREGGAWMPDWSFDTRPRRLEAFADRCRYHQESPESHFTQKPLCTLVTEDGHVTLSDRRLITTRDGQREEREVADPLAVLAERFAIVIPHWPGS